MSKHIRHTCGHSSTQKPVSKRHPVSILRIGTNEKQCLLTRAEPIWVLMNRHRLGFVYLFLCLFVPRVVSSLNLKNTIKTMSFRDLDTKTQNRASRAHMCAMAPYLRARANVCPPLFIFGKRDLHLGRCYTDM